MEAMGWGRYPKATADLSEPADAQSLQKFVASQKKSASCISRGAGRSYGDSALAGQLLGSHFLDSFLALDEQQHIYARTPKKTANALDEQQNMCVRTHMCTCLCFDLLVCFFVKHC